MKKNSQNEGQRKQALDVINEVDTVFHYTNLSVGLEKILVEGQILASRFKELKDPFEYKVQNYTVRSVEIKNGFVFTDINSLIHLEKGNYYRVACFTSNKCEENREKKQVVVKGWARPRMWNQYADNHSGVCLVFSRKALQRLRGYDGMFFGDVEYVYEPELPIYESIEYSDKSIRDFLVNNYQKIFFQKRNDYRDESEYRLGVKSDDNADVLIDIDGALLGVILGDKVNSIYYPIFEEVCSDLGLFCEIIDWGGAKISLRDPTWKEKSVKDMIPPWRVSHKLRMSF